MQQKTPNEPEKIHSEPLLWEDLSDETAATCVGGGVLSDYINGLGNQLPKGSGNTIKEIFRRWFDYINLINSIG